ncbi:MAG: hypothetical protein JO358_15110 [Alphaproteobacteria bacterium]|nr:hypothetical protein [Alphaproteobacteria bacterium]
MDIANLLIGRRLANREAGTKKVTAIEAEAHRRNGEAPARLSDRGGGPGADQGALAGLPVAQLPRTEAVHSIARRHGGVGREAPHPEKVIEEEEPSPEQSATAAPQPVQ